MPTNLTPGERKGDYIYMGGDPSKEASWKHYMPKIGEVRGDYKFLGGNPDEQASWESTAGPEIAQEMHPAISLKDRALVKNLATSPQASINYLQKEYPDLKFDVSDNNQIIIKGEQDKKWRVLDPSSMEWSDITDVGYDIAAGLGTTGAAALGGAAGGLGGGMLAGAGASAGMESLRQLLGKGMGIEQEMDPAQIAMMGAGGAGGTLLFGTGAGKTAGAVLQKYFPGAKVMSEAAQRGVVGRALEVGSKKILPWIGEKASGMSAESIRVMGENLDELAKWEAAGVTDVAESMLNRVNTGLNSVQTKAGENLQNIVGAIKGKVELGKIMRPFGDLAEELEKARVQYPAGIIDEQIKNLGDVMKSYFPEGVTEIEPQAAFALQRHLARLSKFDQIKEGPLSRLVGTDTGKALKIKAQEAYHIITEELDVLTRKAGEKVGRVKEAKEAYKDILAIQKYLQPKFKNKETAYNTLRTLGSKNKQLLFEQLKRMKERYGIDILKDAQVLDAWNLFSKASSDAISSMGTTSTSRSIPLGVLGGGAGYMAASSLGGGHGTGVAGAVLGAALGSKAGSPAALRFYTTAGRGVRDVLRPIGKKARPVPVSAWSAMTRD